MADLYVLDGKIPVKENDVEKWIEWAKTADTKISKTAIEVKTKTFPIREIIISTTFLGMDCSINKNDPPKVFKTTISGGALDGKTKFCSTWEEAEEIHRSAIKKVQAAYSGETK